MSQVLLEAQSLSKQYGDRYVVHNFNLRLHSGEVLGLLGVNGAGKSTTMGMLTGCLATSSGHVTIKGVSLAQQPLMAKQALGYLPEQPPVYPELTVDEYLQYCAKLHGIKGTAINAAVNAAVADCGLTTMRKRLIGNLSKGYQQRVGIAQAIIHRPDVIILDEPTVGLDPVQIREIRALIKQLGTQHSVIISSHIMQEIQAVCSRVMVLHNGKTVLDDSMAHIAESGTSLEERFIALVLKEIEA